VEDRKDYDDVGFDSEVHRIGEATEESAPDPRLEVAILERILDDSIVRAAQLLQKLQPESRSFGLIPLVRRRDVEVCSRLGNQSILGHRSGFARSRSTS
jgi:hypothetical protein